MSAALACKYRTSRMPLDTNTIIIQIGAVGGMIAAGVLAIVNTVKKARTPDVTTLELKRIESNSDAVDGLRTDLAAMRAEVTVLRTELDGVRKENFELQKQMIKQDSELNKQIASLQDGARVERQQYETRVTKLQDDLLEQRRMNAELRLEKDALQRQINESAAAGSLERRHGGPDMPPRLQEVIVRNTEPIPVKQPDK